MAEPQKEGFDSTRSFPVIPGGRDDMVDLLTDIRDLLKKGGGGGTYDGMEARVARLEKGVSDLRVLTATLTERVAHLPSKGFIVAVTLTSLALIAAIVAFLDRLST